MLLSSGAFAANELTQSFTVDGYLSKSGDAQAPLLDAMVGLKIQILDPSKTCVLYEEQQFVNTMASKGYFNIEVGSQTGNTKRTTNDPGLSMVQIYQNTISMTAKNAEGVTCAGGTYTPSAFDKRYLRLIVTPSSTQVADVLSPDTEIDAVPSALVAQSLQGYTPTSFLILGPGDLNQSNLQNVFAAGNASKLLSLLSVNPSAYVLKNSSSGLLQVPTSTGVPSGVQAGDIWYDGGILKYYDGAAVKSVSNGSGITDLNIGSGLTPTGVISTGGQTIAVDTGTSANKIVQLDGSAKLPAVDGSQLTNVVAASVAETASISTNGSLTTKASVAATAGANQNSPSIYLQANYWNGSASTIDQWSIQNILGTGTNPTSTLTFGHTGSSGQSGYAFLNGHVGIGTATPAGKLHVGGSPTATANYPLFAIGGGPFDGVTSGFFTGNANGTFFGVNAGSGYTGDFLNFQTNGVSKFKVDGNGNISSTGSSISSGNFSTTGNISTTVSGTITSAGVLTAASGAASTSPTTGSLVVTGGAGVSGSLNVGANIEANGSITTSPGVAATVSANQSSPSIYLKANYWNGSSSAVDQWGIQNILGTGTTPTSTLTFTHAGTSGASRYAFMNGNVGIGTTAPAKKIDVDGGGVFRATGAGDALWSLSSPGIAGQGGMIFTQVNPESATASNSGYKVYTTGTGAAGTFHLGYISNLTTPDSVTNRLTVSSTGNVGIGTPGPTSALQVVGDISNNGNLNITNNGLINMSQNTYGDKWYFAGSGIKMAMDSASTSWLTTIGGTTTLNKFRWSATSAGSINGPILDLGLNGQATFYGNVGLGTNSTTAKLEVAGPTVSCSGSSCVYENVVQSNNFNLAVNGTLKISLPTSWNNTMMSITISGYNYSATSGAWEVVIGGYNFTGGSWYHSSIDVRGTPPFSTARLAHDGTTNIILLGTTSTAWTYPKVAVTRMIAGHTNSTSYGSGWSINYITDETGITAVTNLPFRKYELANGNFGIGIADPTAKLQLAAGSSTVAPFKLTSGTLLTTPQAGAIEYDGSSLYYTDSTNARRTLASTSGNQTNSGTNTYTGTNTFSGLTNISNTTASTNSTTGALVVAGGLGVSGNINTSGLISTSSDIQGAGLIGTTSVSAPYIYAGAGTGALPSYSFTADTASGLWQPASGSVALSTSGSEKLRVTSNGNVGIGVTAPDGKLHIAGATNSWTSSGWIKGIRLESTNAIEFGGGAVKKYGIGQSGSILYFFDTTAEDNSAAANYRMVLNNGNLGVGTLNPLAPLQVDSAALASAQGQETVRVGGKFVGTTVGSGTSIDFMDVASSNKAARVRGYTFGNSLTGLAFDTGWGSPTTKMVIDNAGNVGLGTSSPSYPLHLLGEFRSESTFRTGKAGEPGRWRFNDSTGYLMTFWTGAIDYDNWGLYWDTTENRMYWRGNGVDRSYVDLDDGGAYYQGSLGIGNSAPAYKLDVTGDVNATGCVRASGSILGGTCASDERLKKEVVAFNLGLKELLGIRPKLFKYNGLGGQPESKNLELGVIAQEVEETAPELIVKRKVNLHAEDLHTTEIKQVNYTSFIYVVINAVKELYQEILKVKSVNEAQAIEIASKVDQSLLIEINKKLEADNKAKDQKINELERRLEKIEQLMNRK